MTERTQPPLVTDERTMLDGWLDYHRRTLLFKCEGLSDVELKTASCPPSNLTLLGLVRHMTEVERGWFRRGVDQQDVADPYCTDEYPEADIEGLDDTPVATVFQRFRDEVEACQELTKRYDSLDFTFDHGRKGTTFSLRWIYTHMIEEYARHNGHADLIREAIDGATGD